MLDYDIIETPENVELERRLTGIGTRFIAGLVDSLIIYVTLFFLFWYLLDTLFVTQQSVYITLKCYY